MQLCDIKDEQKEFKPEKKNVPLLLSGQASNLDVTLLFSSRLRVVQFLLC